MDPKVKTTCPSCGEHMRPGYRVRVQMGWELPNSRTRRVMPPQRGRNIIVCRECAAECAGMLGIEVPPEADGEDL
jgi:hypothetical protein